MRLTVAVCTRNRAESLRRTLTSIAAAAQPHADWETIVVDNGSTDDTASVAASFESRLPIRLIRESNPGLSRARNAAVREARGEYVAWTDDDCVVDAGWLTAYIDAFDRWPGAVVFGGPIVPAFEGSPPDWLTRISAVVGTAYAARDFGDKSIELDVREGRVPFGANYVVRAIEQRANTYDRRLGRGADLPIAVGEESVLLESLLNAGAAGWWVPGACVTHWIPESRQTVQYLNDYFENDGAFDEWRRHSANIEGEPSATLHRRALGAEMRFRIAHLTSPPDVWIMHLISAAVSRGQLRARRVLSG
jgi:glycosyltransferase involved in cell wall biosynthesis